LRHVGLLGALVVATVTAGCTTSRLLPVAQFPNACRGVGLDALLVGDPQDERIAWLETSDGRTIRLVWPPGYVARFNSHLTVLDAAGQIVFREGDRVSGGCVKGPPEDPGPVVLIRPEDLVTRSSGRA
jgi:hypothetical protein